MIVEIKDLFGNWLKVSKEQAKDYIKNRLYNLSCYHKSFTFKYINENIIKGIKIEQLISVEELSIAEKQNCY